MRTVIKFLFALAAILALGVSFADARLTPGTIQKGQYTGANTCNTSQNCYSPSGGSCVNGSNCKGYTDPPAYCSATNASGACIATTDPPPYCSSWYTVPSMSGQICHTNYLLNSETLTYGAVGSGNQKLGADSSISCSRSSNGTNHTPAVQSGNVSCEQGSQSYYQGGSSGVCNTFTSTDNLITSYTQNGQVSRTTPTDTNSSCTVEGRYADPDNSGPTVSVNSVASVFSTDTENWCNIKKYRSEGFSTYGSTQNPALPGCTYYKGRTSHANGSDPAPDMLEGLSLTVSDTSGISDIRVEIGSCDATYSFPTGINEILQNAAGQGTSARYSDQTNIIIPYNATFTVRGVSHPGLLAKFGKTRLDQCFLEGRNFLRITSRDNARSDNDATSYDPNTTTLDVAGTNGYVNIDNSMPKFRLSGDAKDVAAASDGSQCFDGGLNIADRFKNYNVGGNLEGTDPWGADASPSCTTCTVMTETGFNCNTVKLKPTHMAAVWVSPATVNATTGIYTMSYCDGGSPLPDPQTCEWDCSTGYVRDAALQSCVCVFNPANPSACSTTSYSPANSPVCATGYTFDPASAKCVYGGGASLFMLFDETTIANNSTANLQKAKLTSSAAADAMRLVTAPESCSSVPKNIKFSGTGAYYGTVPSWPSPLNTKMFPVTLVCP